MDVESLRRQSQDLLRRVEDIRKQAHVAEHNGEQFAQGGDQIRARSSFEEAARLEKDATDQQKQLEYLNRQMTDREQRAANVLQRQRDMQNHFNDEMRRMEQELRSLLGPQFNIR